MSELVLTEIQEGDTEASESRIKAVAGLPVLPHAEGVEALADEYLRLLRLPGKALVDVTHVAMAVVHEMDYLVTWNCTHIANAEFVRKIAQANLEAGRFMPMIVTPEELLGEEEGVAK